MPRALVGLPLCFVACASLASAQRTTELEPVIERAIVDKSTQTHDIAFRQDQSERMTVPVHVSGKGPYRFLVDTGADRTAVSRELVAKLNLESGSAASLHTLGGVSSVRTATLPNLQLTRKQINVVDAPVLEREHIGADGILGVDSLRSQRVVFDFETDTMSIVPSATRAGKDEAGTIVIEGQRRNGHLIISQARANRKEVTLVLDTGAEISIGNQALRRQVLGNPPVNPARRVDLVTVTGDIVSGEFVLVDRVDVGGFTIHKLGILFSDAHTFKKLKLENKPAVLLGMNALRAFKKISIDFASRKLRVVLPEQSSRVVRMAAAT